MKKDPFDYFVELAGYLYPAIDNDTPLIEHANGSTDEVLDIVERIISEYSISDPEIESWKVYFRALLRKRGFVMRDIFRYFSRVPELDFSQVTVGELCSSARQGRWPEDLKSKLLQGLPTGGSEEDVRSRSGSI